MKMSTALSVIIFIIILPSCYGLRKKAMDTNTLVEHQNEAISEYLTFMDKYPESFKPRKYRKIVSDKKILEQYAKENNVVLGLMAENPYVYFLNDLIEMTSPDNKLIRFPYMRLIYRKQLGGAINTVILATIENPKLGKVGSIVLLNQERHATGLFHLAIPRGFGEINLSGEDNALKELKEETGYIGKEARLIGKTYTDTGLTDAKVSFFHIPITGQSATSEASEEAITRIYVKPKAEILNMIRNGQITDGFTIQALSLYNINK